MKPSHLAWICVALACAFSGEGIAGVYKWVDKNGNTQYGDQPPPEDTSKTREINMSGIPLALQKRLRQMDPGFAIKRITGNLDNAWICLAINTDEGYEPAFVTAFESSGLGTIKQYSVAQADIGLDYDEQGNPRTRLGSSGAQLCPPRPPEGADQPWMIYQIKFDPKAVMSYHGAQ